MSVDSIGDINNANSNIASFNIQKQTAETDGFKKALIDATASKNDKKLMDSCEQFEAYFIQTMYKEMQKTVDDNQSIIPKSQGEKIFTDMLTEEQSKNMTKAGGIGLANMMYKQMKQSQDIANTPENQQFILDREAKGEK